MEDQRRILVALDGSDASMGAVRYLSQLSSLLDERIVLFHVYSPLPEYYWDMEGYADPILYGQRLKEAVTLERESKAAIRSRLEKAKSMLTEAGFPNGTVEIKIAERQIGFARDIIEEARDGYRLVFIGRKGMSNLEAYAIGGVTVKLMQTLDFIPIVLVGESPSYGKALIALDGSACATRALNAIGTLLVKSGFDATLFHAIRGDGPEDFLTIASNWGCDIFASAIKQLSADRGRTKIASEKRSRAAAIMHEANQNGFGTIVVGRKGLSNVESFYTGRVSHKVVQLADKHAVWIGN